MRQATRRAIAFLGVGAEKVDDVARQPQQPRQFRGVLFGGLGQERVATLFPNVPLRLEGVADPGDDVLVRNGALEPLRRRVQKLSGIDLGRGQPIELDELAVKLNDRRDLRPRDEVVVVDNADDVGGALVGASAVDRRRRREAHTSGTLQAARTPQAHCHRRGGRGAEGMPDHDHLEAPLLEVLQGLRVCVTKGPRRPHNACMGVASLEFGAVHQRIREHVRHFLRAAHGEDDFASLGVGIVSAPHNEDVGRPSRQGLGHADRQVPCIRRNVCPRPTEGFADRRLVGLVRGVRDPRMLEQVHEELGVRRQLEEFPELGCEAGDGVV
mmetsp:Transcript_22951/g.66399  ORF Transcript_22951/g.66399 Transcript_22951/m.66399 type:complete len:326 (-) Transcript_22951:663-1640(-)